jgi:hypothetical protein
MVEMWSEVVMGLLYNEVCAENDLTERFYFVFCVENEDCCVF